MKNSSPPQCNSLMAQIVVVGSGPGGVITATRLAEAGFEVLLIEEGAHFPLDSAPHFSLQEITQKYRGGGITVGLGRGKMNYAEGRCVGGGSEINRGLYHRTPPELLAAWQHDFKVNDLSEAALQPHFEACEATAEVSLLPGQPPEHSLRLHQGALNLGWDSAEVPRLVHYDLDQTGTAHGTKSSMSATFVPRFLAAGGHLLTHTWVRRLYRNSGHWHLQAHFSGDAPQTVNIQAETVFVAGGAIQTPALLRRSGFTHRMGDTLRFHPMLKVVARFADVVNRPGMLDPVHQVKEFDPRFSLGCSVSSRPTLALALSDHPEYLPLVDREAPYLALYYAQSTGGRGTVRTLPGFRDPMVRIKFSDRDLADLTVALQRLCQCLFAAGAVTVFPAVAGVPALRSEADLQHLPERLSVQRANLSTLHLFSSCPMGENRHRSAVDSFGKVLDTDGLYVADASLLCSPTVVNPQGSVMAVAHRNVEAYLSRRTR